MRTPALALMTVVAVTLTWTGASAETAAPPDAATAGDSDQSQSRIDRRSVDSGPDRQNGSIFSLSKRELKQWALENEARVEVNGYLPSSIECGVRGRPDNLNLDCDDRRWWTPNNEPDIVVDPDDPQHMIASANDYESCCDQFYTTFNGGKTWVTGDMSALSDRVIGSDPVTSIDPKHNVALHSSLNFRITKKGLAKNGHVVVSRSTDGGLTWRKPIVVYRGFGDDDDRVQVFNDKEWIVTDTDPQSPFYGRTYLTWSRFLARKGEYIESPIWESHSDDGGLTWSPAQEISGSDQTCTYQEFGPDLQCDEDQASVPTVAPDGTVHVAFENGQHREAWEGKERFESQYMVVQSQDGGQTWSDPVHVADQEDGTRDFPVNVDDRQTLSQYQLRVPTFGNIVASPVDGTLYLTFMDNRNGRHDVAKPRTDTDVFLTTSDDGITWQRPVPVTKRNTDQWFPWVEVNPVTNEVGVIYHDRFGPRAYGTSLSTGDDPAALQRQVITDGPSYPRNSLYFRAGARNCPKCATFHGDYINLAYGPDGSANLVWTDMRRFVELPKASGFAQNIFFSRR